MLERMGYAVTMMTSSIEALTTFKNQPDAFDLVMTDQTMPGMTGIDLARRMLQVRPDLPIILCTGYSSQITEEKVRSYGIKGFAMKPLSKNNFTELIRKILDEQKALS
jgi:CheY-like chemotaxis protein